MKFTSGDLMKAMGLQVGDRVKVEYISQDMFNPLEKSKKYVEYEVVYNEHEQSLCLENDTDIEFFAGIVNLNYEILPRPKRVGDLKCDEKCNSCPIKIVCNIGTYNDDWSLYEVLKDTQVEFCDQEIYDLLKARLDVIVDE